MQTKILVLRKNRLLIGLLALCAAILALLFFTLRGSDSVLNLELVLDTSHINSVRLVNLEESVATMYPLIQPSLDALATQLVGGIEPELVRLDDDKKYTQSLLMEVITATLKKAAIQ